MITCPNCRDTNQINKRYDSTGLAVCVNCHSAFEPGLIGQWIIYNYQLKVSGHAQPIAGYVDHLIKLGKEYDAPFTIEMIEPEMIVCFWQPGMEQVAYNETYKRWYEAQQVGLQEVLK